MNQSDQNPTKDSPGAGKKFAELVDYIFLQHPHDTGERYFEHLLFTLYVAQHLIISGICAVLHGLCPRILTTTTSARVMKLSEIMAARRDKYMTAAAKR